MGRSSCIKAEGCWGSRSVFSEAIMQEIAALLIAVIAFVYLMHKIAGWPRLARKKKGAPVVLGDRLARGLKSSRK